MTYYCKPPLSIAEQAELLLSRGLICSDQQRLEGYLASIGYYRLSAYWRIFENPETPSSHQFIADTSFDSVLELYIFDRKLRLLVMEAVERIEVALRAQWSGQLGLHGLALHGNDRHYGSHAYLYPDLFKNPRQHIQDLAKIDREFEGSKEVFIEHYRLKYTKPPLPPIWAVVETMTLGALSRWFQNTQDTSVKKCVMHAFGMPTIEITESIFHALTPIRNVCAHHSRLWNRRFPMTVPNVKRLRDSLVPENAPHHQAHYLYNYLVVLVVLMKAINPSSTWRNRLVALLNTIDRQQSMGFPSDWQQRPIWTD